MTLPYRYTFSAMTTQCELQFFGVSAREGDALAKGIVARVAMLVARYNFHATDSWLNREVNGRRHNTIALDEEAIGILALVRTHAHATEGAFDITVGTYAKAVRAAPSVAAATAARAAARAWMGLAHWWLEGNTLHFDNPYTRFDLGGVIKEYAVDEARRLALRAGVRSGLINFGGDLATIGHKPDGKRFVAAVPDPFQPAQMLFGLDLENQALTTSGHYARQRKLPDGTVSHILGAAPEQRWASASVVSSSALLSGIYSTSLLIKPDITLPPDVLAVTVDHDRRVHSLAMH